MFTPKRHHGILKEVSGRRHERLARTRTAPRCAGRSIRRVAVRDVSLLEESIRARRSTRGRRGSIVLCTVHGSPGSAAC